MIQKYDSGEKQEIKYMYDNFSVQFFHFNFVGTFLAADTFAEQYSNMFQHLDVLLFNYIDC